MNSTSEQTNEVARLRDELEGYKRSFDILMEHFAKIVAELTNKTK
jgi:hypothetical protein